MWKYVAGIFVAWIIGFGVLFLSKPSAPKEHATISPFFGNVPVTATVSPNKLAEYVPVAASVRTMQADHGWVSTISADRVRKLVVTGDVIPARSVNSQTTKRGDFTWAWQEIVPVLRSGDLTVINLESPLVTGCPVTEDGMVFCGDVRHMDGIKSAGVDVVTVANNHFGNWGKPGIDESVKLLTDAGMSVAGLGEPAIRNVRGLKYAFLAYNDIGGAPAPITLADPEKVKAAIADAKTKSDLVVVAFHWGVEYVSTPSARQVELAHTAVDAGADLVIGNHPHWVQPTETYNGKWVTYAHGNTIFDQMWSEETKLGVIGIYTFVDRTLVDVEFVPTRISDYGRSSLLSGPARDTVLRMMAIH